MARPSPEPYSRGLVVKKGSKTRSSTSGVMPLPVSLTASSHVVAGRQVGQRQQQRDPLDRDRHLAPVGHGVAGVDHQIEQGLLDLGHVDPGRALHLGGDDRQLHLLAQGARQDAVGAAHGRAQVDHPGVGALPAGKGEQPAHQGGGPIGGGADAVQLAAHLGLAAQPEGEQLGRPHDGGEQVVELVGDAARQPADRLHLLGVQQLLLEALALAHVGHQPQRADVVALLVVQRVGGDQGPDRTAAAVAKAQRVDVGEPLPVPLDHAVGLGPHLLVHELAGRVAQHALDGLARAWPPSGR